MEKWIARLGLATLATLASSAAFASDYYLSDCQVGAAAGCVAGSNATGAGTPASPWQTTAQLPALRAGDTVSFAKGGSWVFSAPWFPAFGTRPSPIRYTSYQGAWCSGGSCASKKPLLTVPANTRFINLSNGGNPVHKEGIVISALELTAVPGSTNTSSAAVFVFNDSDWITLDDLTISGFSLGVHLAGSNPPPVGSTSDGVNQHITIRNSDIHENTGGAILGSAVDLLIENNRFDNNGSNNVFDHNLYLSGTPARPATRMTVRGNTSTRSATGGTGICRGVHFVFHGILDDVVVENNVIDGSSGAADTCYGIGFDTGYPSAEIFRNVVVRGNTVVNVGNVGIAMDTCQRCTIEGNLIVWTSAAIPSTLGIVLPGAPPGPDDATQDKVIVRNNSIYIAAGGAAARGIRLDTYGANHQIVSNLIYFGAGTAAGHACFTPGPLSMYAAFDNNLCYDAGANGKWSATYSNLAAAQRAGFDVHGLNTDPRLSATPSAANGYSMALNPGSPAIGSGNRALSTGADIGAWQQESSAKAVPPAAPVGVVIQ